MVKRTSLTQSNLKHKRSRLRWFTMPRRSSSEDSETMEAGSTDTPPQASELSLKSIQVHLKREELEMFLDARVQITRYGETTPTIWGMATSIDGEPGHEVFLLMNVQVHDERFSEYHIPVSTIKQLETIAGQQLVDTFTEFSRSRQSSETALTPRSRPNSRASQPRSDASRHSSMNRSRSNSRSSNAVEKNDHASAKETDRSRSNSRSGQDLMLVLSETPAEEPHTRLSSKSPSPGKATAASSSPSRSFREPNPERRLHSMFCTWAKWAAKKLKKERSSALLAERNPDFRLALITAFDACQIMIDDNEIRSIEIKPDDNLQDPEFLKRFWQSTLALPSRAHHEFFCEKQDLQMFGTKRGTYRQDNSLQYVKNVHIPIVFTSDGHLDKIYLETYYDKCESKLPYEKWIALQNVRFYAQLEQLAILEPRVYRQALSTEKQALLEAYLTEFAENGAIGFEAWYDGQDARPRHDGKLTTEYQRYSQPSSSAKDDEVGTDRPIYTSTPKGSMDEMSQEATASPSTPSILRVKKKEDGSIRVLVDASLLNQSMHRLPLHRRTVEQQEIARKFPTDSQRATAKAMADEANFFRPRLTTAEKDEIPRTPTGLKFDHYSNADFVKHRDSRIAAHTESYADYKRIMAIDSMKSRIDQSTEQTWTDQRSRSTSQRSEGRATAPTDLTEYSANSDELRKIFALSAKPDDSKDQIDRSEQIRRWELEAQKLIARAPSRKRDKLQKVHDNWHGCTKFRSGTTSSSCLMHSRYRVIQTWINHATVITTCLMMKTKTETTEKSTAPHQMKMTSANGQTNNGTTSSPEAWSQTTL
jgi:hypothetical protein